MCFLLSSVCVKHNNFVGCLLCHLSSSLGVWSLVSLLLSGASPPQSPPHKCFNFTPSQMIQLQKSYHVHLVSTAYVLRLHVLNYHLTTFTFIQLPVWYYDFSRDCVIHSLWWNALGNMVSADHINRKTLFILAVACLILLNIVFFCIWLCSLNTAMFMFMFN